ncbi:hypothetical protein BSY17_3116 [Sphingobium sp. RAC03]|nr:hypothetical protein BSY17_3116 [Sphingobium sp. RAC03]
MRWRLVLDDLQATQAGPLVASTADEKPSVWRGGKERGARRREIGLRIEIARDADRMTKDNGVSINVMVDIDASHELD